jgi:hypothetical protein
MNDNLILEMHYRYYSSIWKNVNWIRQLIERPSLQTYIYIIYCSLLAIRQLRKGSNNVVAHFQYNLLIGSDNRLRDLQI